MKKITITISSDGSKITSDAEGFKGNECLEKAQALLSGMGGDMKVDPKSAMYEQATVDLMN